MQEKPPAMRLPERPPRGSGMAEQGATGDMPHGSMVAIPEEPAQPEGFTGGMPIGAMNVAAAEMAGGGMPAEMPSGAMATDMASDDMRPLDISEYGVAGPAALSAGMPAGDMTNGERTFESQNFEISGKFRLTLFPGSLNVR